ncbi:MAG: hypothetical protein HXY34_03895 [Candidatus Thorarchaeota archaeon]|nr:hypothetical protein [Candidatus Thorarchaeota archaeon]
MLQILLETLFLPFGLVFIALGLFAYGWLAVHISHARHTSWSRVIVSLVLGALLIGFGIHFVLVSVAI